MIRYNWEQDNWPNFKYNAVKADVWLFTLAEKTGHFTGMLKSLPASAQMEAVIDVMTVEAIKTSAIEGEFMSRKDVMSSIKKNLGLVVKENIKDKKAKGISELMVDVRNSFSEPLTKEKLFVWHAMLLNSSNDIEVGKWRTHKEPMQIVSGAMGKQKIHFEAPPSVKVPKEMQQYIQWYNDTAPTGIKEIIKAPLRSAIAHLYFESIHPFEDGNGRIGRALAEKALSQGVGRPVMLSLSKTIEANKNDYYAALSRAQQSADISNWINYFIKVILDAQTAAEEQIEFTLKKVKFFDHHKNDLNERQLTVIKRMLEEGPKGFEGGMNARKYTGITKASKATATRDLQDLANKNIFVASGGGRSTSYQVNI
jgi:Fic family protein